MNSQVQTASEFATRFEAFIADHPIVVSILLAFVISWGLTAGVVSLLRAIFPDHLERALIRLFDIVVATVVAIFTWPSTHAIWWALAIGVLSPFGYAALSELLVWKWPNLRKHLSLRELAGEPEPVTTTKDQP